VSTATLSGTPACRRGRTSVDYLVTNWSGSRSPKAHRRKPSTLCAETSSGARAPDVREKLAAQGAERRISSREFASSSRKTHAGVRAHPRERIKLEP